jgi:MoxR-like ATPase
MTTDLDELNALIRDRSAFVDEIESELEKVIVGQKMLIERLMTGLLSGGHVLVQGVPGLAKTLTVSSLADCVDLEFQRIQFTPDLLPADLIGTMVFDQKDREFVPRKGPVFTNVLLADEINRAPAKVQSALLEAMQEKQVTIGETTYELPEPFLVLATQNPIEQEGTYPLPEAQVDRFMLKTKVDYPTKEEERTIMDRMTQSTDPIELEQVARPDQILQAQETIREVYVDDKLKDYIVDIVFATRNPADHGLDDLEKFIDYGASPRASIYLNLTARTHAFIQRRGYVQPEDIKAVARDVLRHRVILTYVAEAEEYTSEQIVDRILETVEVP